MMPFQWVGEPLDIDNPDLQITPKPKTSCLYLGKEYSIGDHVLTANSKDDDSGSLQYNVASILHLYEMESNKEHPFRALVQWYSRVKQLSKTFRTQLTIDPPLNEQWELVHEGRRYQGDLSIKTIIGKCQVLMCNNVNEVPNSRIGKQETSLVFFCRFALVSKIVRNLIAVKEAGIGHSTYLESDAISDSASTSVCDDNNNEEIAAPTRKSTKSRRRRLISSSDESDFVGQAEHVITSCSSKQHTPCYVEETLPSHFESHAIESVSQLKGRVLSIVLERCDARQNLTSIKASEPRKLSDREMLDGRITPVKEVEETLRRTTRKIKRQIIEPSDSESTERKRARLTSPISSRPMENCKSSSLGMEWGLTLFGIMSYKASLIDTQFQSGKFIMLKSDLKTQKTPCMWRIDGKNMLQKYEPISYYHGVAYRNSSTYSSWMATKKCLYVPIEVKYVVQSHSETIVTFDCNNVMLPIEEEIVKAVCYEAKEMARNFQTYLQTLLSQALDSNFLKEIAKENDEYFLSSMAAIENDWILPKRKALKGVIKMKKLFQDALESHPGLELQCVTFGDKPCYICGGRNPTRSFKFQTFTYDFDSFDIMEGNPSVKIYRLCLSCTDRVLLYHKLFHMRYNLFLCCQAKIQQYDQTDGPAALESSLADNNWKSLMHRQVFLALAETQEAVSQHSASICIV